VGADLPKTYRAIELTALHADPERALEALRVAERPLPEPGPGEVLVRVSASPVNPSDLLFVTGHYVVERELPTVPGWEGSGRVIAAGPGLYGRLLKGRRVACAASEAGPGTWGEYTCLPAMQCLPLLPGVDDEQGASLIVNPVSAWAMLHLARERGARAVVSTAAAGQLGRMVLALAKRWNFPVIHVVRRAAQVELLKELGADVVLDSSEADFDERLAEACLRSRASVALDAIGGPWPQRLLSAMGPQSRVVCYGVLDESPTFELSAMDILGGGCAVEGFYLGQWLPKQPPHRVLRIAFQLQRALAAGRIRTKVARRVDLEELPRAMLEYYRSMTAGKTLLRPHGDAG
jgi:NADPH2:quinone reductase